jgi:hypothetical protein
VKPFPAHHLLFVQDTNLPVSMGDGTKLDRLEDGTQILKVLDDRPSKSGTSTEYKVRWKQKGKPDAWLPETEFGIGFISNHIRKSRPFKKRKSLPRQAQKKSAYSF